MYVKPLLTPAVRAAPPRQLWPIPTIDNLDSPGKNYRFESREAVRMPCICVINVSHQSFHAPSWHPKCTIPWHILCSRPFAYTQLCISLSVSNKPRSPSATMDPDRIARRAPLSATSALSNPSKPDSNHYFSPHRGHPYPIYEYFTRCVCPAR
jgi:hypothetical protein